MIVLDASVLIAHLDGNDAFHARAVGLLRATAGRRLAASVVTVAEVLVGPARTGMLTRAEGALGVLQLTTLGLGPEMPALLARVRADTGLKLPDCCVLLAAQQSGADALLTFDDRLRAAAETVGLAVDVPE